MVVRRNGSGRSVRALRITRAAAAAVGVDTTARPALEAGAIPPLVSIGVRSVTRRATAAVEAERNTAARDTGDVTAGLDTGVAAVDGDGPARAATRSARGRLRSFTISVADGETEGAGVDAPVGWREAIPPATDRATANPSARRATPAGEVSWARTPRVGTGVDTAERESRRCTAVVDAPEAPTGDDEATDESVTDPATRP